MATLINGRATNLTNEVSVRDFWPDIVNYFKADKLEAAIGWYIKRAEVLLNSGTFFDWSNISLSDTLEIAANLTVRRLVWMDTHPAAAGEAAGLQSESVRGVSYSLKSAARSLEDLLGPEIIGYLDSVQDSSVTITFNTTQVFDPPVLTSTDANGNVTGLFDIVLDDVLLPSVAESLRLSRSGAGSLLLDRANAAGPFTGIDG